MSNTSNKRTLYVIIILLLLLVNGVGLYFLLKGNQENEDLTTEINEVRDEYTLLQADLNTQLAELNMMKGKNAELDSVIAIREAEILLYQEDIEKWKNQSSYNASQLKDAKTQIADLLNDKQVFQAQLDSMFIANKELHAVKEELETNLAAEQQYSAQLEDENSYLDDKFEIGSILQADELSVKGIKVKDNGVEKQVDKAKNCEKILVCYQTGVNNVREAGTVTMQLRLISPGGETLYQEIEGSGVFTSKADGQEVRFTKQGSFDYNNDNMNICMEWSHNVNQSGTYQAEIYQEGYLVGTSSVTLK